MCNTRHLRQSSKSSPFHSQQQQRQKKRHANDSNNSSSFARPTKRVSFSESDCVLGRAQDYDRTSFEVPSLLRRRRTIRTLPPTATPPPAAATSKQEPVDQRASVFATTTTAGDNRHDDLQQQQEQEDDQQHANFCGMWRRSHGFNWAALLEFSGVDKAAIADQAARMNSSSVVHLIDHDAHSFRLVVHSDTGGTQDQHFFIGGQPRPTAAAATTTSTTSASSSSAGTLSNMRWSKNGEALVLSTLDAATGNEMTVSRHLACEGTVIVQHYTARRAKTGETAEAITIFRRMAQGSSGGGDDHDLDDGCSRGE